MLHPPAAAGPPAFDRADGRAHGARPAAGGRRAVPRGDDARRSRGYELAPAAAWTTPARGMSAPSARTPYDEAAVRAGDAGLAGRLAKAWSDELGDSLLHGAVATCRPEGRRRLAEAGLRRPRPRMRRLARCAGRSCCSPGCTPRARATSARRSTCRPRSAPRADTAPRRPGRPQDWWRNFRSPELDGLIERARAYNNDLAAAAARVIQADAQVRISGAPLLPRAERHRRLQLPAQRHRQPLAAVASAAGSGHYFDSRSYSVGLQASYDLDLFGRNRALLAVRRRRQRVATRFDQETVALAVVTSVASHLLPGAGRRRTGCAWPSATCATPSRSWAPIAARLGGRHRQRARRLAAGGAGRRAAGADLPNFRNTIEQNRIALGILVGAAAGAARRRRAARWRSCRCRWWRPACRASCWPRRPDVAYAEAQLVAAERQHPRRPRRLLPRRQPDRVGRADQRRADRASPGPARWSPSSAAALTQTDLRQRPAPRPARTGQGPLRRAGGRLPQGGAAGLHRRRAGADRAALRDRAGGAGARGGRGGAALGRHRPGAAAGRDDRHHHLAQHASRRCSTTWTC